MSAQEQNLPELQFWDSKTHISKEYYGVKIDVFENVSGAADLIFPAHTMLMTAPGTSVDYQIDYLGGENIEYCNLDMTVFLPKNTLLKVHELSSPRITVVELPENLLQRTLHGVSAYSSTLFNYFDCSTDQVLIHSTELLSSIVLDDGKAMPDLTVPLIEAILVRVIRNIAGTSCDAKVRRCVLTPAHLTILTGFIDRNISRAIRLPELAHLVGLSQFHFARAFKIATNTSPMRYVLQRRVEAAKKALSGNQALAEIALDAGFASQSHFTTAFRQVSGVTPSVWRSTH